MLDIKFIREHADEVKQNLVNRHNPFDLDKVLELTPRELALMQALMAKPGHAVSKEQLFELVFPGEQDVQYEAIEVVVYRLRKKLTGTRTTLMTLRGLGYLLKGDT